MKEEQKLERSNTMKKIANGITALIQAIFRACGKKDKDEDKPEKNTVLKVT